MPKGMTSFIDDNVTPETMSPAPGRIIIQMDSQEMVTKSGIIIPETGKRENATVGTVVQVGRCPFSGEPAGEYLGIGNDGKPRYDLMPYQIGDRVFVGRWVGIEFKIGDDKDTKYVLLKAWDEVFCRLPKGKKGNVQ